MARANKITKLYISIAKEKRITPESRNLSKLKKEIFQQQKMPTI